MITKNAWLILALIAFTLGCKKDEETKPAEQKSETKEVSQIPFKGTWKRTFEAGPGNLHTVLYKIYQDSIRYSLNGPVGQANYLLIKDTFITAQHRFIGHTEIGNYYLIFTKLNSNKDTLTLYKQPIKGTPEGLAIEIPSDTTTKHHGWNKYYSN